MRFAIAFTVIHLIWAWLAAGPVHAQQSLTLVLRPGELPQVEELQSLLNRRLDVSVPDGTLDPSVLARSRVAARGDRGPDLVQGSVGL